ncbi:MAG: cytochrome c biogenesis protein CcdA [Proteiniphilum sp.]|uniref:protein-disulfide reductase DsbD family protein n=1 Tax=Proteiniphilum sp. TaxID=1926877 RepID=UPI002B2161A3|nr:cytochrome c biogenesis protein CcdA [Proteiniphilum sp.]MEA5128091.1 cytochrome c biogenesis protein CcdA [Proteiniphilum sp.]
MKKIAITLFGFLFLFTSFISAQDIVTWNFSLEDAGNGEVNIIAKASVQQGWYMYDTKIPDGGPNPTMIEFDKITGAETVGEFQSVGKKATVKHDEIFEMELGIFKDDAQFVQRLRVTGKANFSVEGNVRAQACNDQTCTPPLPVDFSFSPSDLPASLTVAGSTSTAEGEALTATPVETDGAAETEENISGQGTPVSLTGADREQLWSPVIEELNALGADDNADASLWSIFLKGLLWGFAALITPCVWPMIPITVSFFLNRNKKSRKKAIQDATIYGLSIIIIYVTLGLIITAIFGAAALNNIATSPVFNLIFFALLITFAFSFMGAFEIVLPSSWTNKMDSKVDSTTGFISLFFMAFTLALVSFSCTGPIIGWLLVDAATQGNFLAPALGMFGFAFALAIPFTLFAIFPSWLKTLPKSGSWLNSVKVVLGFIVLAVSLKFLSVADLSGGWGILNRDIFLALWIVIFGLLGFYLLGKIKMHGDSELTHIPLFRLFLAILTLAFTVYLVPGLWGAPLKPISSIVPPLSTQDFKLAHKPMGQVFNDYEAGMAYAAQTGKPVLLEFGGHGCVNCHKMDATVLADDRVRELIDGEFVFIVLMVDERTRLPETIEVDENGRTSKLRTVGDKWSYLQRHKFGTQSQPFYVVIDQQGKPLSPAHAYDESVDNYIEFLQTGLKNFNK